MSSPPNRLASFRSYSYYHVLVMCDSSQTATAVAASTDLSVWEHATPATRAPDSRPLTSDLGPYAPKKIEGAGRYIVLINGSTDAAYVITDAKWMTATGAEAAPGDRSTSIAVEGSIKIAEPKGVAFLDQVIKCCVALGVDSAQAVYLLKTFFVGHLDSGPGFVGGAEQDGYITDIPPVMGIVYDVTGSFTEAGGTYEMEFVGAAHGASRLPQYSKAVNGMSITAGDTLEETLRRLEDNINSNYTKYFDCVYQQISSVQGDTQPLLNALRRVKYVIEAGEEYTGANASKYTVTNQPQQYKNSSSCSSAAQITFPAHTSIETAIRTIMMMSPQVLSDMASGDASDKIKYEFKIHTALISEQANDAEEGVLDYTVYYRIERFMTPKTISYDPAFDVLQQDNPALESDPRYERIRRNIIKFDYMYTGNNTDILEFDMKVNMGMAYLQTATLANTFKSQLDVTANRVMQPSSQDINNHIVRFGAPVQTPVFFGSQIRTPSLLNTQSPSQTIQSAYTLNKHASLEVTDVTMRIMGNTNLLGTTNRTTSPEYVRDSRASDRTTTYTSGTQRTADFVDWTLQPAYVKVNIKMPRENDDFALYTGQSTTGDPRTDPGATDYARDFWFDGYYYVVGIEHVFSGGEFTQVLSMLGLPKRSAFQTTQRSATREVDINASAGSCFDNAIGIRSASAITPPTVPSVPPAGITPTTRLDAASANKAARNPSDVIGWDTASPAVRTAIIDAANRYNVPVVVLAQFARHESSFDPNAKAPTSSATGLFQLVTDTWNSLIRRRKIYGVQDTTPDQRFNPTFNAYGGAALLRDNIRVLNTSDAGDLYLAHFIGVGTARSIISADELSGGKVLVSSVMPPATFDRIRNANPSIIRPSTTVGELRAWAATSMAKTLKQPVRVATQTTNQQTTAPAGQAQPSPNPSSAKRTADQPITATVNPKVQTSKDITQLCGPSPNTTPRENPQQGGGQ